MLNTEGKIEYFKTAIEKENMALKNDREEYDRLCNKLKVKKQLSNETLH